jgi:4,5-dihydroxyphthalate decarboxylase
MPLGPAGGAAARPKVTLAIRNYDSLWPLCMGDVRARGVDVVVERSADALDRALKDPAVDGGEISFARHIQRLANGEASRWVEIPAYVMRGFTQRCIYVRRDSDLVDAAQLAGKRIGTNEWPASGNTWTRAMIRERGVSIDSIRWTVGKVSANYTPPPNDNLPAGVAFQTADRTLVDMLLAGELDAIMSPWPPDGFYAPDSGLRRLYADFRAAERAYWQRTRVYPVRHIVGIRRELVERHPGVVRAVYDALDASRRAATAAQREMPEAPPWAMAEWEETVALMGEDFQPYGIDGPNRKMIATLCDELLAQGFLRRPVDPDSVFAEWSTLMQEESVVHG